ncbi:MAG: SDR family oxidoreductase [Betaproteobacteria bacterium]|nr:SDR family oxidoreductase [Betaproteobacteria bacterium]
MTGTSSGIGFAIAELFIAEGASVLGVDREPAPEIQLRAKAFRSMTVDLSEPQAAERIVATCIEGLGMPDILVNNAGIGNAKPVLQTTDAELARYFAVNVIAPFGLCRAVIPVMRGRGGAIVNVASVSGLVGTAQSAGYGESKAAVAAMTRNLATEFGRDGIRVNAVAPGLVVTPLTRERASRNTWFKRMYYDHSPMGRDGLAQELAHPCLFLASDEASYVNGVVLAVDGGWSIAKYLPDPAVAPGAVNQVSTARGSGRA